MSTFYGSYSIHNTNFDIRYVTTFFITQWSTCQQFCVPYTRTKWCTYRWKIGLMKKSCSDLQCFQNLIIDRVALGNQGDNVLGTIHPSVSVLSCRRKQRSVIISPGCLSLCRIIAQMRSISFYLHPEKWNIDLEYLNMLIGLQCSYILC